MKKIITLILGLLLIVHCNYAQLPEAVKDKLEKYVENAETEQDYTALLDDMLQYFENPLNLNTCAPEELMRFPLITPLQANAVINHRQQFGELLDPAELQVTGFTPEQINLLLPFISVELSNGQKMRNFKREFLAGKQQLISTTKRADSDNLPNGVLGNRLSQNLRLRYYGAHFSIGFSAEKDAGERYWKRGPDFYSGHVAVNRLGKITYAVLGDFTLNFGQGLVLGSNTAMGKGANVLNVKRDRPFLKEYRGLREAGFFRGAAAQIAVTRKVQLLFAASSNAADANIKHDSLDPFYYTSFDESGYHRTFSELSKKGTVKEKTVVAFAQYSLRNGNINLGFSHFNYNVAQEHSADLYRLFYPLSQNRTFLQLSQSHTLRNVHFFSEWAYDITSAKKSMIAGVMAPCGSKAEIVLLFRHYDAGFVAHYNSAFGRSAQNEQGFYAGTKYTLSRRLSLAAYSDIYRHPWLQYGIEGAAYYSDFFVQADQMFTKKSGLYVRIKQSHAVENSQTETVIQQLQNRNGTQLRLHINNEISTRLRLEARAEANWVSRGETLRYKGSLLFVEVTTKTPKSRLSLNTRFTVFAAENYDNRIYVFENPLMYEFSSPAYYGKGASFYILANVKLSRNWKLGIRYTETTGTKPGETITAVNQALGIQVIYQTK